MNRKDRRKKEVKQRVESVDDVPLARPPTNPDKPAKTLYELAAERQAALGISNKSSGQVITEENVVNVAIGPNGEIKPLDGVSLPTNDEAIPPWIDTLMLSITLSALHFTLTVLTYHQYAEEVLWKRIAWSTVLQAFPLLSLLVHFAHGHLGGIKLSASATRIISTLKQLTFVALANTAGCYLVKLTNSEGYMAVMKDAPGVGTIWVWCVIELGLAGALAGVAGPGLYAWYNGYGIF